MSDENPNRNNDCHIRLASLVSQMRGNIRGIDRNTTSRSRTLVPTDFSLPMTPPPLMSEGHLNGDEVYDSDEEYYPRYIRPGLTQIPSLRIMHKTMIREAVRQIPSYILQDDLCTETNEKCEICQQKLAKGNKVRTLPCMHTFHSSEVKRWMFANKTCPVCNMRIEPRPMWWDL